MSAIFDQLQKEIHLHTLQQGQQYTYLGNHQIQQQQSYLQLFGKHLKKVGWSVKSCYK